MFKEKSDIIYIWTDGSGNNITRIGGCGIVMLYNGHMQEYSIGRFENITSAKMEVWAILYALQYVTDKTKRIQLYCDNSYCVNALAKGWLWNWEQLNFIGKKHEELWREIIKEIRLRPKYGVSFHWVRGHQDKSKSEYHQYNCLADALAGKGAKEIQIVE